MTNKELEQLGKEAQRDYHRQWRAKNKDKVKQYNKNYWIKKALLKDKGAE